MSLRDKEGIGRMTDRIIDISTDAARLHVRHEQLVIEIAERPEATVPLAELACLVVSNPRVSYSHTALAGLAAAGGAMVVCDEKHLPIGMMLPLAGHSVQAERFEAQAQAAEPKKKQIWKQLVTAKIGAQGRALQELRGKDLGLGEMARRVKSGDTENLEAQASRRYWPAIFNDEQFRRDRQKEDQNRQLNYGYAVLRAIVARAICGAGLHPSLGVFHHNRYDTFCLADDLMEPFRPLVDRAVVKIVEERGRECPMDKECKAALIGPIIGRYELEGEDRTLFDIAARTASSLAQVFMGKAERLVLPEV
jgi:CRISP-associated protein Cas1